MSVSLGAKLPVRRSTPFRVVVPRQVPAKGLPPKAIPMADPARWAPAMLTPRWRAFGLTPFAGDEVADSL